MSHYRKIDTRIWNDEKFRELTDAGKLAFFMLLTHPHMTAIGAMRATIGGLAEEVGWSPEAFREAFNEASAKGMAKHDGKAHLIALPRFLKYNPPESPNVVKAWGKSLDLLPECGLKVQVIQWAKDYVEGLTEGFAKALPEAFAKGMPYQEQEQEQEQEQKSKDPPTDVGVSPDGGEAASEDRQAPDGDLLGQATDVKLARKRLVPACPHQDIIGLYHEILPTLPQVLSWSSQRPTWLQARWKEEPARQNLDWWRQFFELVSDSDWLMGRRAGRDGRTFDGCTLEWLIRPNNFAKVIEGQYNR